MESFQKDSPLKENKTAAGFTLIEIAVVIVIVGFIMAGIVQGYSLYLKQKQLTDIEKTYDSIQGGLRNFVLRDPDPGDGRPETNSRYPCPASPTASPYSATYGEEFCSTTQIGCQNDVCVVAGTNGLVFIGSVPTKTLGISAAHAIDPYGNRLTYAVTADLTVQDSLAGAPVPAGSITIDPTLGGTPITDAHFAVVTHGEDGAGSYTAEGARNPVACRPVDAGDAENCDYDDAIFSELERTVGDTVDFYDDTVAFTLSDGSADIYWGPIDMNPQNIRNLNDTGMVWIGPNPNPAAQLGNTLVVNGSAAAIQNISAGGLITAGQDVTAIRDILAGQDLSATRGLIVGPVTNPDSIGAGSIAAGSVDAATIGDGSIVAENDMVAGGLMRPGLAPTAVCDATLLGAIRYNDGADIIEYCAANGGGPGIPGWAPFGAEGGASCPRTRVYGSGCKVLPAAPHGINAMTQCYSGSFPVTTPVQCWDGKWVIFNPAAELWVPVPSF